LFWTHSEDNLAPVCLGLAHQSGPVIKSHFQVALMALLEPQASFSCQVAAGLVRPFKWLWGSSAAGLGKTSAFQLALAWPTHACPMMLAKQASMPIAD
jgi:hypothetical protein